MKRGMWKDQYMSCVRDMIRVRCMDGRIDGMVSARSGTDLCSNVSRMGISCLGGDEVLHGIGYVFYGYQGLLSNRLLDTVKIYYYTVYR
jgi:hypothetical protein